MIRFVTNRGHGYTLLRLAAALGRDRCEIWDYDRLFRRRALPDGTWIFADHERLAAFELRLAARVADLLIAGGAVVFNHPARVRGRAELLGALRRAGINSFSAWRAEDAPKPDAFPVFLRSENDHAAPEPDLISTQSDLDRALDRIVGSGVPLRGILVVQYRGEEIRPGVWRKLSTFRVGDSIVAYHHVVNYHWIAKRTSDPARLLADENLGAMIVDEREFVLENRHEEVLGQAFEIARIDYGRADFGIVGGRPEIYEINTNPEVPVGKPSDVPGREQARLHADRRLLDAFRQIDVAGSGRRIRMDDPVLEPHQGLGQWLTRSRMRP